MSDNKIVALFFAGLAVLAFVVVGQYNASRHELAASKVEYVQTVCDIAHDEISGASEQACGDAQDQTGTEYLCNHINTSCWVEVK